LTRADQADREAQELVAEICAAIIASEPSFIARNFYRVAEQQARAAAGKETQP
jgi:hypothetical protein